MPENIRNRERVRVDSLRTTMMSVLVTGGFFMVDDSRDNGRRAENCVVTKAQLQRFFDVKFAMADRDHDGQLNVAELSNFLRFVTHPDLRSLRSWDRFSPVANKRTVT